ncbi:MAG: galactose mutarotase [Planctomycetaceae bacterium]|nr:galactose mutarotase [Planctomycetaceae bacterium]
MKNCFLFLSLAMAVLVFAGCPAKENKTTRENKTVEENVVSSETSRPDSKTNETAGDDETVNNEKADEVISNNVIPTDAPKTNVKISKNADETVKEPVKSEPAKTEPADAQPAKQEPVVPVVTEPVVTTDAKPVEDRAKPAEDNVKPAEEGKMNITKAKFGSMPETGEQVNIYTLTNAAGASVQILNLGGIIYSLNVPDRDGKLGNISARLDTVEGNLKDSPFFGALVGRYGNRIAGGKFTLDGEEYQLATNDGGINHLHGGKVGFNKKIWDVEELKNADSVGLKLTLVSPDGDENYPGTLHSTVVYTFDNNNVLTIDYTATTDKATPVNLTNHTYFNLSAFLSPTILDEVVEINADHFIPVNETLIPTGEIAPVADTPMDFRTPTAIGARISQVGSDPKGYDHCYVLNQKTPGELTLGAKVHDPQTGRTLELWTTEPGVQFYTGNFLDGTLKSGDITYPAHAAFCLETEHFPDSPNQPNFPSAILKPGETYRHTSVFKFGVQD